MGHSSAVRLKLERMDKLPKIVIPRHLSEGFLRIGLSSAVRLICNVNDFTKHPS
jgi:hypothetical protein